MYSGTSRYHAEGVDRKITRHIRVSAVLVNDDEDALLFAGKNVLLLQLQITQSQRYGFATRNISSHIIIISPLHYWARPSVLWQIQPWKVGTWRQSPFTVLVFFPFLFFSFPYAHEIYLNNNTGLERSVPVVRHVKRRSGGDDGIGWNWTGDGNRNSQSWSPVSRLPVANTYHIWYSVHALYCTQ